MGRKMLGKMPRDYVGQTQRRTGMLSLPQKNNTAWTKKSGRKSMNDGLSSMNNEPAQS